MIRSRLSNAPAFNRRYGTLHFFRRFSASCAFNDRQPPPFAEPSRHHVDSFISHGHRAISRIPIRQQLQSWEKDNPTLVSPIAELKRLGEAYDNANELADEDNIEQDAVQDELNFNTKHLRDFGAASTFLRPGDLIEHRHRDRSNAELAIFVKEFDHQGLFYTMSGRWLRKRVRYVLFSQPAFVSETDLQPLLDHLPSDNAPMDLQERIFATDHALPRNIGAPLLRKMSSFWKDSEMQYRNLASRFDRMHTLVAHSTETTYITTVDMAEKLAPSMRNDDGSFPDTFLYAVHRCLLQDNLGFRPQLGGNFRVWGRFEVTSIKDIKTVLAVTNAVRRYQEHQAATVKFDSSNSAADPGGLKRFAAVAADVIRRSRERRDFTQYGMLSPVKKDIQHFRLQTSAMRERIKFDPSSRYFIRFITLWSAYRMFGHSSGLNATASAILRATGMYDGVQLDQTTGWTFLQELGVIEPWSTRAKFDLRWDHLLSARPPSEQDSMREDNLAHIRKDWGSTPVFCIDNPEAKEIDDGVSFEKTDRPDESWIHVHAADPASHILPRSQLALYAQNMASSIYLPTTSMSMIPKEIVGGRFSLASGRPCLTFSAKVDATGALLDYKITAGRLNNVKYITPDVMRKVVNEVGNCGVEQHDNDSHRSSIQIGNTIQSGGMERPMADVADLTVEDKEILRSLSRYAVAHREYTSQKGAIYTGFGGGQTLRVNLPDSSTDSCLSSDAEVHEYSSDPSISMTANESDNTSDVDYVMHLMLTAGNVAARWCADRGIPNLFRASQHNPGRSAIARHLSKEVLQGFKSTPDYVFSLGPVLPSSIPGPHVPLGMDMYSKATSPLRRYGDLVTHWQIGAALLEEHRTGQSLIGNTDQSYLPFSMSDIDAIIPALDSRERALRMHQRTAERGWAIQALIRAWKYGQSALDKTFVFNAVDVNQHLQRMKGNVYGLQGIWATVNAANLPPDDSIAPGMQFEVEIEHLNCYTGEVIMKALRRL